MSSQHTGCEHFKVLWYIVNFSPTWTPETQEEDRRRREEEEKRERRERERLTLIA